MNQKSAFCIATSRHQAGEIADGLKTAGFFHWDISMLLPVIDRDLAPNMMPDRSETILLGAIASGDAKGAFGWVPGFHARSLPDIGALIVAGPLGTALTLAVPDPRGGALAVVLMGFGLPEAEARRYEKKIKTGDSLIAVHPQDEHQIEQAQEIFLAAGALDLCVNGVVFHPRNHSGPHSASRGTVVDPDLICV